MLSKSHGVSIRDANVAFETNVARRGLARTLHVRRATLPRRPPFLAIFPRQGHKSSRIAPQEARRPRHRLEEENNFAGARTGRTLQSSATNDDEFFSAGHTLARAPRVREREASIETTHRRWLETIGQVRDDRENKEIGICMGKAASERQRWKMGRSERRRAWREITIRDRSWLDFFPFSKSWPSIWHPRNQSKSSSGRSVIGDSTHGLFFVARQRVASFALRLVVLSESNRVA